MRYELALEEADDGERERGALVEGRVVAASERLLDAALPDERGEDEGQSEHAEAGADEGIRPGLASGELGNDPSRAEAHGQRRQAASQPGQVGALVRKVRAARSVA